MPVRAGKLRRSQSVTQFGPGAVIDMPSMSMIVLSADHWDITKCGKIDEPRLARKMRVNNFRSPPWFDHGSSEGGLLADVFPGFLVCPNCRLLAHYVNFTSQRKGGEYRFLCTDCESKHGREVIAFPSRFMVACGSGHLADFPWHNFVHPGVNCGAKLLLKDSGRTGAITDLTVYCPQHQKSKNLGVAFGPDANQNLPRCSGEMPWLPESQPEPCSDRLRVLLRGASNSYFASTDSAISIPPWSDPIQLAIGLHADAFANVLDDENPAFAARSLVKYGNYPELVQFTPEQVLEALSVRRNGGTAALTSEGLRREEWNCLNSEVETSYPNAEFRSHKVEIHWSSSPLLDSVVAVERLREVRALKGFTRIDPNPDIGDLGEVEAIKAGMQPSASAKLKWLPGAEFRGEGIFFTLREDRLRKWESRAAVLAYEQNQAEIQAQWNEDHGRPTAIPKPPRFTLLHTLSHLIVRQLSLDCGYSSAALRERIYCSAERGLEMAGVLIYTATPDLRVH